MEAVLEKGDELSVAECGCDSLCEELDIKVPNPTAVRDYLKHYTDILAILPAVVASIRTQFGVSVGLTLVSIPECIILVIRQEYDEQTLKKLKAVWSAYDEKLKDWLHVTVDNRTVKEADYESRWGQIDFSVARQRIEPEQLHLLMEFAGIYHAPMGFNVEELDIKVPNPPAVCDYLERYPDIADLMQPICEVTREKFGVDAELSLEVSTDPEIDDEYLVLYVRQEKYSNRIMYTIHEIWATYQDKLVTAEGCILVTTDFQPPTDICSDSVIRFSPAKQYTTRMKIESITKGEPRIVEPEGAEELKALIDKEKGNQRDSKAT